MERYLIKNKMKRDLESCRSVMIFGSQDHDKSREGRDSDEHKKDVDLLETLGQNIKEL